MPKHSKFIALASAVSLSVLATSASAQVSGSVQVQGGFGVNVPGQVVVNQPQVQPVGGQVVVVGQPQPQPLQTQVVVQQPRPIGPAVDQFGRPIGATAVDQFGRPIGGTVDTLARPIGGPIAQPIAQPIGVPYVGPVTQPQTINLQVPLQPQGQPDRYVPPSQPGQVWVPGGWQFVNGQQQWIAGHWETPPQPGQVWMQPQQGRRGRRWWYRQGYWGQPQQIGNQYLQPGAFGIQAQVRPYQLGQIMTGALDTTDFHSPNGGYADDYAVFLQAGQPVTFVVTGGPSTQNGQLLDVVASLHFQGRELASDDDGAGYPHARLVFTPRVSGVYALRVASYGARYDTGSYSIQSWAGAMQTAQPFAPVQNWGWGGTQPMQPQPQPVQVQPMQPQPQPVQQPGIMGLNIGTQIQGMLQPGDSLNQRGSFVDQYAINLFAGQPITIVARGVGTVGPMGAMNNTPDVMLDLVCNGQQVGHDDDSAGNHNARLVITPQQNTQCVVQVSTFGGTRTVGAYQLVTVQGAQPSMQ
jgi:hypothetical protein